MTDREPTPITASWGGHTQYRCRLCAFDTLEEAKFIDHFAKSHPPLQIIDGGKGDGTYVEELDDPLGALRNDEYAALTPAEKGQRTKQANAQKGDD